MTIGEQAFIVGWGVFMVFLVPLSLKQGLRRIQVLRRQGLVSAMTAPDHSLLSRRATIVCAALASVWVVGSVIYFD